MADTKISDLTAVTTPASTDEFAVNQGGTTKKETRAQLHSLESGEHLVLPQVDEAATPTLAFGDGDTGFYESAANQIRVAINGGADYTIDAGSIESTITASFALWNESTTATNPVVSARTNDADTGLGSNAADQLSLIAGGVEMLRLTETGVATTDQLIIGPAGIIGGTATPALAFGDGDTGFWEDGDDVIAISISGSQPWEIASNYLGAANSTRSALLAEGPTSTNPNIVPRRDDLDTGIGRAGTDAMSLIAGGVEAMRFTGDTTDVIISNEANVGLTADVGSAQGNGVITSSFNVYSTVGTAGDAATLPATFPVGTQIFIKNDGANSMDVFPASGDNAGAGVDTAVAVAAGAGTMFLGTVADSTWTQMYVG